MASKLRVSNMNSLEGGEDRCLLKLVKVEGVKNRSSFVDSILPA